MTAAKKVGAAAKASDAAHGFTAFLVATPRATLREAYYRGRADAAADVRQRRARRTQMTLRTLIAALQRLPPRSRVPNLVEPHAYRGYYSDLALERAEGTRTAAGLRALCQKILNTRLPGYKSGMFTMHLDVPVWLSDFGRASGTKLVGIAGTRPVTEQETWD